MEEKKNYGKNRRSEAFAKRERNTRNPKSSSERESRFNERRNNHRSMHDELRSSDDNKRSARKSFFSKKNEDNSYSHRQGSTGFEGDRPRERRNFESRKPSYSRNENDRFAKRDNNSFDSRDRYTRNDSTERGRYNNHRDGDFKPRERNTERRNGDFKPRERNFEHRSNNFSTGERRFERKDRDFGSRERGNFERREENNFQSRERKIYDRREPHRVDRFDNKPREERRNDYYDSEILREIMHKRRSEGRRSERKQKILSLAWGEERGPIRLNKYISNSGICSRREADDLITAGAVTVNGTIVTELGTKVMPTDEVRYEDKILQREKPVYLLLNKPKDFITTTEDERDRNSVMQLIEGACPERVYPVGRLDRNTTGLLLFTNDGELTKKLTHPKFEIKKIYQVELDKNMSTTDFQTLQEGIELYDGFIKPDELSYVDGDKHILGITLHSGKNRIVRRMFAHFGYEVEKLDRVYYASLTKKDLPRGQYRFLTQAEVNILKMSL